MDPPPLETANVTVALAMPFPFASASRTDGALATNAPTVALCPFDAALATVNDVAGPATKVTPAVSVNVDPASDALTIDKPAVVDDVRVAT